MSDLPLAIGVDFGGTSIKTGVLYRSNIIDDAPPIATQGFESPEALIDAISRTISDLRERHPKIEAVGIGMPGFVDFEKGIVHNLTNVEGWRSIPLRNLMIERVGLPCIVENDANCMAYAEWKRGAGRGMKNIIALTLGTGVGGGVIVNGQIVRGARSGAGEIGQMSIDYQGRVGAYNNSGSLEDYIGNNEIAADARQAYADAGIDRNINDCTPHALSLAAQKGDEIAIKIWETVAGKLASALVSCCYLLNPQAIIIGGGVAKAGEVLFSPLQKRVLSQLSGPFRDYLQILPARFSNEAGMIGAATLGLERAGFQVDD